MKIQLHLQPSLDSSWTGLLPKAHAALRGIADKIRAGGLPILSLAQQQADLPELAKIAADWRGRFRDILILGTGGSSLGGKSAYALADAGFGPPSGPRLHFMDNVDPHSFENLRGKIDAAQLGVIAISKSGSTAETLCQLHEVLTWLPRPSWAGQILILTEPGDNSLRRLGQNLGCLILDHHPQVGGRYSIFSNVGMLPILLAGLSAEKLRRGAAQQLEQSLAAKSGDDAPATIGAALAAALLPHGVTQHVVMPYVDRLRYFAAWYQQLWAESLGKNGRGITPIAAIGTVDQHSQLQLYLDGPRDKFFTLLILDTKNHGQKLSAPITADARLNYLYGRSMGDLLLAEARATAKTLADNHCPLRVITLPHLDEAVLGGLYMHYMLETIITADLLGVNPFDQPAVEAGKILTREYMQAMAA
jgi:glucose-6-phosphate isomerase